MKVVKHGSHQQLANYLQSIVDAVNDIVRRWSLGCEARFVLLDDVLLSTGEAWEAVNITHSLVRSSGSDLSSNSWVHAGHLQVDTNIGIVDVNNLSSTEELDVLVVADGMGSRGKGSDTGSSSECGEELTTLGGKLGGAQLGSLWGNKGSGNAVFVTRERLRASVSSCGLMKFNSCINIDPSH